MNATINLAEHSRSAFLRLHIALQNGTALDSIGRAVTHLIQRHFESLPPNQNNFPTTHFWQRAADATTFETEPGGVRIDINQVGICQRLFGGSIKPVRGKYLTIPAIAETYGHAAADFAPLKIARVPREPGNPDSASLALVPADSPPNPTTAFFWLVRSVTQLGDPHTLPSDDEILSAAEHALRDVLK